MWWMMNLYNMYQQSIKRFFVSCTEFLKRLTVSKLRPGSLRGCFRNLVSNIRSYFPLKEQATDVLATEDDFLSELTEFCIMFFSRFIYFYSMMLCSPRKFKKTHDLGFTS